MTLIYFDFALSRSNFGALYDKVRTYPIRPTREITADAVDNLRSRQRQSISRNPAITKVSSIAPFTGVGTSFIATVAIQRQRVQHIPQQSPSTEAIPVGRTRLDDFSRDESQSLSDTTK